MSRTESDTSDKEVVVFQKEVVNFARSVSELKFEVHVAGKAT
jgi:hypothetical protein